MPKIRKICIPSPKNKKNFALPMQKIKKFRLPMQKLKKNCIANAKNNKNCSAVIGLCIWQFSIVNIYIISMQFHLLSIGCHVYSYSTVNRRTFDLLHKLQLLPAMDCSGTPHVVDHCSPRWSAVVPLYFHCTLTANISSVATVVRSFLSLLLLSLTRNFGVQIV